MNSLKAYSAMTAAFVGAAFKVDGQVEVIDLEPDSICFLERTGSFNEIEMYIDINQDGTDDFKLFQSFFYPCGYCTTHFYASIQPLNGNLVGAEFVPFIKICHDTIVDTLYVAEEVLFKDEGEVIDAFTPLTASKVIVELSASEGAADCYYPGLGYNWHFDKFIPLALNLDDGYHYGWMLSSRWSSGESWFEDHYFTVYEVAWHSDPDVPVTTILFADQDTVSTELSILDSQTLKDFRMIYHTTEIEIAPPLEWDEPYSVQVLDINGRVCSNSTGISGNFFIPRDTQPSLYILKIESAGKTFISKVLI